MSDSMLSTEKGQKQYELLCEFVGKKILVDVDDEFREAVRSLIKDHSRLLSNEVVEAFKKATTNYWNRWENE